VTAATSLYVLGGCAAALDYRLTVDKHITMGMIQSRIGEEYEVRGCLTVLMTRHLVLCDCMVCVVVWTERTSCCSVSNDVS
jgi:hypothetical protein